MLGAFALVQALVAAPMPLGQGREILIHDEKSAPESLTISSGGDVIVGSASSPVIYIVRKGGNSAEPLIDLTAEGPAMILGVLADKESGRLWSCYLTRGPKGFRSSLRGFDITSRKEILRWDFPGESSTCNDITLGPDRALYVSDTNGGKIYRLRPGGDTADLFMENRLLFGVDGITFLDGVLYVNNVFFSKLYRIPVDEAGKPGDPVDIWMDAPVKGPDGMRASHGRLLIGEGIGGRVTALKIQGDIAHVVPIKDGLLYPTGVDAAGDAIWITERSTGKIWCFLAAPRSGDIEGRSELNRPLPRVHRATPASARCGW
jgi:sugar lactone lactonase YvrE